MPDLLQAMPVAFVSHGSPIVALDAARGARFASMLDAAPKPTAVIVVSAHWETRVPTIGSVAPRPLIHDVRGYPVVPPPMTYAAPTAPDLARRVEGLLKPWNVARAQDRGWDHGVWVPLVHMIPDADVPVMQISLAGRLPAPELLKIGATLAPLRTENVLVLCSGGVTHNLRLARFDDDGPPPAWAAEVDEWCADVLARWDVDAILDYRRRAPAVHVAHPTEEHFLPLLVAVGAASERTPEVSFPLTGFDFRTLSRRSVRFA